MHYYLSTIYHYYLINYLLILELINNNAFSILNMFDYQKITQYPISLRQLIIVAN